MKKNKTSYVLALLMLFSNISYAQQETEAQISSQYNYLNIKNSSEPGLSGYDDIAQYLANKEKEKKIQSLASYISDEYNVDIANAQNIVQTSFLESEKHQIEPMLILSIIGVESKFNFRAISGQGAVGLTQIMPKYHKSKISSIKKQHLDLFSIKGNIVVGIQVIKEYIALANGNIQVALQMYNGTLFDKKKAYSKKVFAHMKILNDATNV
jgi:soluble lytic murein transglycosylase-like protein